MIFDIVLLHELEAETEKISLAFAADRPGFK